MAADTIIIIPTSLPRDWSWIERVEEELLLRGVMAKIVEKAKRIGWHGKIDKDLIYDILSWRCLKDGTSVCPAVVFEGDRVYLLMLDEKEEKFVKVMDLEEVIIEGIRGVIRYSDCIAKYGYDYC
jgi:hypothetical protein